MKRRMMMLLVGAFLLPTLLSACIVAPLDDGYYRDRYDNDGYGRRDGHHHHHDRDRRGGWYDGRRY